MLSWPREWGPEQSQSDADYLGWSHRYRLEDPIAPEDIQRFEAVHGITLPAEYRAFLTELGNGGAGPGYGIWPLGKGEDGPLPDEMLQHLSDDFAHSTAWNDTSLLDDASGAGPNPQSAYYDYSVIAGAIEIGTDGCGLYYLLVLSGPASGQVWYDKRADGEGIEPLRDEAGEIMSFGKWYSSWIGSL